MANPNSLAWLENALIDLSPKGEEKLSKLLDNPGLAGVAQRHFDSLTEQQQEDLAASIKASLASISSDALNDLLSGFAENIGIDLSNPPDTTGLIGPDKISTASTPTFSWDASDGAVAYNVMVDGNTIGDPTAELSFTIPPGLLGIGSHTFQVSAVNASGEVDPTPASYEWTVVPSVQDLDPQVTETYYATPGQIDYFIVDNDSPGFHRVLNFKSGEDKIVLENFTIDNPADPDWFSLDSTGFVYAVFSYGEQGGQGTILLGSPAPVISPDDFIRVEGEWLL